MKTMVEHALRVAGVAVVLVACFGIGSVNGQEPKAEEVAAVISQAQADLMQARSLGHGWSVTSTYIQEAESALAAKQLEVAWAAAERASLTAKQAIRQAEVESSSWQDRAPSL